MVEAGGIEPPSEDLQPKLLHAYSGRDFSASRDPPDRSFEANLGFYFATQGPRTLVSLAC